ncbi:peptidyl-prolyl cis-trans isomerase SlyD, FKBP-type [Prevotella disiens FB035-09AN]|uniref:peptidylprolyl isomerase n=1 Tax=Prevotella disiens FB035-09AN TaxID=866771 RepID=E1KQV5_9BACT|nr:peptidylprolyl isomerase [Prevotella disiens]EFL46174.1 peptidyl-prolyl cis-trans isomerase SlyD, FKBP-type [Prevotella disiens FB035-09AN]
MENQLHKFMAVDYELYSIENGNDVLVEKTQEDMPLEFYSNCDMALPDFEEAALKTPVGEHFEFVLEKGKAYGEYSEENVLELDKALFSMNGEFDSENVYEGAVIPLQNEEGQRFMAKIIEITDNKVKADFNHPLAGKELKFKGHVKENRDASEEEVKAFFDRLNTPHCGCGCGCGSNGNEGGCGCYSGDESCGCGCGSNDNESGCGCYSGDETGGCGCGSNDEGRKEGGCCCK